MKRFHCISNAIIALLFLSLVSCEGKFVLDPIDPRLPKYTESGNEASGAFVNKDVWKSVVTYGFMNVSNKPYFAVYSSKDSVVFAIDGDLLKENNQKVSTDIKFHLKGLNIHNLNDLRSLENKTIQFEGTQNYAAITIDNYSVAYPGCYAATGTGQIYFRYVKINELEHSAIVSGTFGFTAPNSACGPVAVTYGRFDYIFKLDSNLSFL